MNQNKESMVAMKPEMKSESEKKKSNIFLNTISSSKKNHHSNLIVVTAPSGAGKSTIISRFLKKHPNFGFCVSHTTRDLRPNEKEGQEYYFLSESEFKKKIERNEFIEWAKVYNHYYGTSFAEIDRFRAKKKVILDVDIQGSFRLQKQFDALYIFISVPDVKTLKNRLINRGTEEESELEIRLKVAKKELSLQRQWKHVIMNKNIDEACEEFETIVNNFFGLKR